MEAGVSLNFDRVSDRYDESRGGAVRGERIATDLVPWLAPGTVLEVASVPASSLLPYAPAVHGVPLRVPADVDVARALVPLAGLRDFRSDTVAALDEAAAGSLEPVGAAWVAGATLADTPNAVADSIERRLWSYLWDVDEPTWRALVAPVVAALRALPGSDRARRYDLSSRLVVFARCDVGREREPVPGNGCGDE